MSEMQPDAPGAARMVVGHPFNPPYLIPLVEVVGGARTDPGAVVWAAAFYRAAGKYALTLERELPGFIANRLQDAMWREALHMVAAGEARSSRSMPRSRPAPGCAADHGPVPDLPPRRRAGRHGAHARSFRPRARAAVDPTSRTAAHAGAARAHGRRLRGRGRRALRRGSGA